MAVLWNLQKAAESVGCMSRRRAGLDILLPPFAVMVGSGLTSLQARQLCGLAEQHLLRMGLTLPELPTEFPTRYLQVFSRFPSGFDLQEFLEIHLKDREPSPACRELARLVGPNGLTNLVLTVNFCDEIPDAVRERGLQPWVLDHPDQINERLVLSLPQIQIVKLHGAYLHFDSCNLEAELKRRARQVRNKVLDVLAERTVLVLGYSGWKGDAFLSALRHHLTRRTTFPGSVWWFCYSDDDYQRLPRWLVNSPYVRMVTPSASNQRFLDGREVLAALRTEMARFREATPLAVPVPVRHSDDTVYAWADTESRDEVLRHAYYFTVPGNPKLGLSLAQERQRLLSVSASAGKSVYFLEALYSEAYSLRQLGRSEEALEQFSSVAERASFGDPLLRGRYAHARNGEAVALADLGRHHEALAVWSHVVGLPTSDNPQVRQARDFALNNMWLTQRRLGLAEELDTFALLMRQLSASNDPLVLALLRRAIGVRLTELREVERVRHEELTNRCKTTESAYDPLKDEPGMRFRTEQREALQELVLALHWWAADLRLAELREANPTRQPHAYGGDEFMNLDSAPVVDETRPGHGDEKIDIKFKDEPPSTWSRILKFLGDSGDQLDVIRYFVRESIEIHEGAKIDEPFEDMEFKMGGDYGIVIKGGAADSAAAGGQEDAVFKRIVDETRALRDGERNGPAFTKVGNSPWLVDPYPAVADLLCAIGNGAKVNVFKEVIKALDRQLLIGIPEEDQRRAIAAEAIRLSKNKGGQIDWQQDAVFAPILAAAVDKRENMFKEGDEAHQSGHVEEALVLLTLLRQAVEIRLANLCEATPVRRQHAFRYDGKIDIILKDKFKVPDRGFLVGIRRTEVCLSATRRHPRRPRRQPVHRFRFDGKLAPHVGHFALRPQVLAPSQIHLSSSRSRGTQRVPSRAAA